ncbi:hypothetical protein OG693_39610 (plasmid) [Streptomyces sp. NBC_01259]|uniref:hypothetical protein n=1 Tax=Streptomyces sp. NBC_01259 TaxID=2903800 RepID=UPI002F919DCB
MFGRKTVSPEVISANIARSVKATAKNPRTDESLTRQSESLSRSVSAAAKRAKRNGKDDSKP